MPEIFPSDWEDPDLPTGEDPDFLGGQAIPPAPKEYFTVNDPSTGRGYFEVSDPTTGRGYFTVNDPTSN